VPADGFGHASGPGPVSRGGWSDESGDMGIRAENPGFLGHGSEATGHRPPQPSGDRHQPQASEDEYLHGRVLPPHTYPPPSAEDDWRDGRRREYDPRDFGPGGWRDGSGQVRRDGERGDYRGGPRPRGGYRPRPGGDFGPATAGWPYPGRDGYSPDRAGGYVRGPGRDFGAAADAGQWQADGALWQDGRGEWQEGRALWQHDGRGQWSGDGPAQWSGDGPAPRFAYDMPSVGAGSYYGPDYIPAPDGRYEPRPDVPGPEQSLPEPARPELALPEPARPELPQPEPARPEQPEPARPELPQPEQSRPEPPQPEPAQPELLLPDAPQSAVRRPGSGAEQVAGFGGDPSRLTDSESGGLDSSGPRTDGVPSSVAAPDRATTGPGPAAEGRSDLVPGQNLIAEKSANREADRDDDTVTAPLPVTLPGATSVPRPEPVEEPRGFFEPARPSGSPAGPISVTGSVEPPPVDYAAPVTPRPMPPKSAAKLDQIKDLYLTAEAIGEDALDRHFGQVSQRQHDLIKEFFQRSQSD
jgi:hypothetical protein